MKRLLATILLGMTMTLVVKAGLIVGGNSTVSRSHTDTFSNFEVLDRNNPINGAGQIIQWQVFAASALPVELLLYHPTGVNSYSLIGNSAVMTPVAGVNTFALAAPIPVLAGDVVGLYFASRGSVPFDLSGPFNLGNLSGTILFTANNSGVGNAAAFIDSSNRTYSVSVSGNAVPEPSTITLSAGCLLALFVGSWRRRKGKYIVS